MEEMLLERSFRKKIIREIKGDENIQRKIVSYKKMNMQNDNFHQYVKEYLESKLDAATVKELHIFSNVNLQRRISKSESSIYTKEPERDFFINDKEIEEMSEIYKEMDINTVLRSANEAYKYQEQCCIQVYPDNKALVPRVLLPHHYDVIPDPMNPEKALAYVISNFDNTSRDKIREEQDREGFSQGETYRDGVNQTIADYDDSSLEKERFYVWSKTYNYVMDGKGMILDKDTEQYQLPEPISEEGIIEMSEDIMSPLAGMECLPFIDVATKKDFEFWVRSGDSLYDTTIMYNNILTSEFQTVQMQGHAQAYYKGSADHMPENIRVGVDKMIFVPVDPDNAVDSEFGFAKAGADLNGIREFRESFLRSFLSSRGNGNIVSGTADANNPTSGIQQLLQMIEKFESSQEDFSLFRNVEMDLCWIIQCWIKSLYGETIDGEPILDEVFQLRISERDKISCNVSFAKPELYKTEMESLELAEKEIDMGISSRVHLVMELKGMTMDQAKKHIMEVDKFEQGSLEDDGIQPEILEDGGESEI